MDLDDETWMRQCIDGKKRWALRGRELDNAMRVAASPAARAEALAALERHETEYKVMCRRENEVGMRRAQLKNERDIAAEGWDNWLRRMTKERDEIRAEGWDNWYRRRLAEHPARADDQSAPSKSRRPRRGAAKNTRGRTTTASSATRRVTRTTTVEKKS